MSSIRNRRLLWQTAVCLAAVSCCLAGRQGHAQQQVVQNRYLRLAVQDSDSRWQIARVDGDPLDARDDSLFVTWNNFNASKVTLWVQSNTAAPVGARTGIVGGGGGAVVIPPSIQPDGQTILSQWRFPANAPADPEGIDILVTQRLTLVRDLVRLEFEIKNQGVGRAVGLRVAFDPAADNTDLVTNGFFWDEVGLVTHEREFRSAAVPDKWLAFFPANDPFSFVQNVLRGLDATPPDRLVFGGFNPIIGGAGPGVGPLPDWDFIPNPLQDLRGAQAQGGDGSVALYWLPRLLGPQRTRRFVTYLGAGVADHARNNDLVAALQTPFALPLVDGRASPGGFRLHAFAYNLNPGFNPPLLNAILELPPALQLAELPIPQEPIVNLEPFSSGVLERGTDWLLETTGLAYGDQEVSVIIGTGAGNPVRVRRRISIPHEDRVFLRNTYQMMTIPYQFADSGPEGALGLDPSQFQALRWDPRAGIYREVQQLVPGESVWIRLIAGAGQVTNLQQATPVDIPEGQVHTSTIFKGWNQVGNASPWPVNLEDLRFTNVATGQTLTFDQAVRSLRVRPTLWRYDVELGRYVQIPRGSRLQPGEGFWIFANQDLFVLWPAPTGPGVTFRPQ